MSTMSLFKRDRFSMKSTRRQTRLRGAVLAMMALWLLAWVGCSSPREGYEPYQPIKFNHKLMAGEPQWGTDANGEKINNGGWGIPCRYCHTMVDKGRSAGIPSENICMNCHSVVGQNLEWVLKLKEYYDANRPIEWIKVHDLPDFVYFNHAAHMTALNDEGKQKVDCVDCHGEVEKDEIVRVQNPFNMGWCLECHWKDDMQGPFDCIICHR